jgi:hypothetical protein
MLLQNPELLGSDLKVKNRSGRELLRSGRGFAGISKLRDNFSHPY